MCNPDEVVQRYYELIEGWKCDRLKLLFNAEVSRLINSYFLGEDVFYFIFSLLLLFPNRFFFFYI